MKSENITEISVLLKSLSHPARLMIVLALAEREHSVGELEAKIDVHQPTLSQQLGVLRNSGIVRTRRSSKQILYRLSEKKAKALVNVFFSY